jgi:cysteinyl-tRNA synthetase
MFMLMSHYRSPLNYSGEILLQAQNALERVKTAYDNLKFLMENGADGEMTAAERAFADSLGKYRERVIEDMDDDFNTADAISVIFELVREANTVTAGTPTRAVAGAAFALLDELQGVLGLIYDDQPAEDDALKEQVEALIQARQQARAEKNWAEADRIRDALKDMGIVLMDTKQGVQWKKA